MKQKQLLVGVAALLFLCAVLVCFACLLVELVGGGIWQERLNEGTLVEVMQKMREKDIAQVFRSFCADLPLNPRVPSHYHQTFRCLLF